MYKPTATVATILADRQIQRAHWHDYRQPGFYMLTITCLDRRQSPFGTVIGQSEAEAAVALSSLGQALEQSISNIPDHFSEIEIIETVVMPDHCHILLQVHREMEHHLGAIVGNIKTFVTQKYLNGLNLRQRCIHLIATNSRRDQQRQLRRVADAWKLAASESAAASSPTSVQRGSAPPAPPADAYTERLAASYRPVIQAIISEGNAVDPAEPPVVTIPPLFATGYHDRIVNRRGQIADLKRYIRRNPARLWIKRHTDRHLMTVSGQQLSLPLPLAMQLKQQALYWDERRTLSQGNVLYHDGRRYAHSYLSLIQHFLRRHADGEPFLRLRFCGNRDLLDCGRPLIRVRISRSVTRQQLEEQIHSVLDRCEREGAVVVSPFISWSEKEVLKALRMNGYPHVIIDGEGMPAVYKPSDSLRQIRQQQIPAWWTPLSISDDASDMACCQRGELLIIAPWPDRPHSSKSSKPEMEIMNELARVIALREGEE